MAVADASGLMDIASTLAQDEIPFKLRCAICNNLALNAFRLPCCDQSICHTCQASLSNTCPVCTHTPVAPDLCKPNKALRTTLKAFLRTEEKKRERERQSVTTPSNVTSADPNIAESTSLNGVPTSTEKTEFLVSTEPTGPNHEVLETAGACVDTSVIHTAEDVTQPPPTGTIDLADETAQSEATINESRGKQTALDPLGENAFESIGNEDAAPVPSASISSAPGDPTCTVPPNAGSHFSMGWNGNTMNPYMANMFSIQNSMGMPMGMGPMADQGVFGDYGMNMTGMGMNFGNYGGMYGSYGSLGWDGSHNIWQGDQNKFNPNAFANGMGSPYGGTFAGSHMPAYPHQFNHYGKSSGRGSYRGRGRGFDLHGSHRANSGYSNHNPNLVREIAGQGNPNHPSGPGEYEVGDPHNTGSVQGIPTIDNLASVGRTGPGSAPGLGVKGAPVAPRAMREGLPNTTGFQRRGFQSQNSNADEPGTGASKASVQIKSRSASPSHSASRPRSPSAHRTEDDRDSHGTETKRMARVDELQSIVSRTPSPSRGSSRRSSKRKHYDGDLEGPYEDSHTSQRSRRRRSCSHSPEPNGDTRSSGRRNASADKTSNRQPRRILETSEARDLASRIHSSRRSDRDRAKRRGDDRSYDQDSDTRHRDRDRDRRDCNRGIDRQNRPDDREDDRLAEHEYGRHDRPRGREQDRKRPRRDRSRSFHNSDYHQTRRVKRSANRITDQANEASTKTPEPEKDPYTLERQARNKERLQREQQHREKAKPGRRRSRQDRIVAGRRINYKYEDEL